MQVYESTDLSELNEVGVSIGAAEEEVTPAQEAETKPEATATEIPKPSETTTENRLHTEPPTKPKTWADFPKLDDGKLRVSRKEYIRITSLIEDFLEAEQEFDRVEAVANYLAEQSKEAKERLKQCEEAKDYLFASIRKVHRGDSITELSDSLVVEPDGDETANTAGESGGSGENGDVGEVSQGGPSSTSSPETAGDDNAWRTIAAAVLFSPPIKGCGQKKIDAITAQCPTLGAFDDVRCEASQKHVAPHTLLPKGVGADLADVLVERLLNAQRTPVKLAAAEGTAATETTETAETKEDDSQGVASQAEPSTDTDAETEEEQISRRIDELQENSEALKFARNNENAMSGYRAAKDGLPASACPWTASDKQDEWLTGWIVFESEEEAYGDVEDEPGGDEGETEDAFSELEVSALDSL